MRFALVDDRRAEPAPRQTGICPSCGKAMIAKCGTRIIWHWAHKAARCDGWWEPETVWHRAWKNRFPDEWQEVVCAGIDDDRHVADVLTSHGLVIEFQHSRLDPEEQRAREAFYPRMVWVVDGTRLASDASRFMKVKDYFHPTHLHDIFVCNFSSCFPRAWLGLSALVAFDFGEDSDLWCLFPGSFAGGRRLVAPVDRGEFVRLAHEQGFIFEIEGIIADVVEQYRKEEALWFGRPPWSTSGYRRP